jgi:hypothetical protein
MLRLRTEEIDNIRASPPILFRDYLLRTNWIKPYIGGSQDAFPKVHCKGRTSVPGNALEMEI